MQKLVIKEFSLQAHTEFERPVSEQQAGLSVIADSMLVAFPYALRAEDVTLFSETKLYDYRLVFRLFNGSADVTLTSRNLISNFRDGRTSLALNLVAKSVEKIYQTVAIRPIQFNQLTFSTHAQFESPEAYNAFMTQFVSMERGYLSGGKIVQADAREFKGELRFTTEKSVLIENGLFVFAQFLTKEPITGDLSEKMAKRFAEIAGFEGIELNFPE